MLFSPICFSFFLFQQQNKNLLPKTKPFTNDYFTILNTQSPRNITAGLILGGHKNITTTPTPQKPSSNNNINNIPGLFLGIPLNILTQFFMNHHYSSVVGGDAVGDAVGGEGWGFHPPIIFLQFLIGVFTYGGDKYRDALQYEAQPFPTQKAGVYLGLLERREFTENVIRSSFYLIAAGLFSIQSNPVDAIGCLFLYEIAKKSFRDDATRWASLIVWRLLFVLLNNEFHTLQYLPFVVLLDTSSQYIWIKRNFGWLKPFYVAFMWSVAVFVMPVVIEEHDYTTTLLQNPAEILLPFSLLFSLTNLQDLKDVEEDRINGVQTLPVLLGTPQTKLISLLCGFVFLVLYNKT